MLYSNKIQISIYLSKKIGAFKMGLESLPHLALGNTKKGLTQIVMSPNGGGQSGETAQWLVDQKDDIKEQAYQTGRSFIAKHTKTMNKMCLESYLHVPTIKSLEYFSEIRGLITPYRESLKLLTVKNPISFGATVFQTTKEVVRDLGARVSYYPPSEIVGLEAAKKGMLVKDSFIIDYNSHEAVNYADLSEANINRLDSVIEAINYQMKGLNDEALSINEDFVAEAVITVLDLYHLFTRANVKAGLTYTVIEDKWLNKKSYSARDFAPKMMELYDYAERNNLVYETPYPSYEENEACISVNNELAKTTAKERALYTEVFDHIKAKAVVSSNGKRYQLGHLIPQNIYIDRLVGDLEKFLFCITDEEALTKLRLFSEC